MCMETFINDKPLQALLDMGADTVYIAKEVTDEVGLSYIEEGGYVKAVNARSLPSMELLVAPLFKLANEKVRSISPLPP